MRLWPLLLLGLASFARADRILLVPIDSRPAAGQFAQMIGKIADVTVSMPPYQYLGRFTNPGTCEDVLDWLEKQDYKDVSAVVVSIDMVAYGGLIGSRTPDVPLTIALHRLRILEDIRRAHPKVRFYGFSSIMRLYATGTAASDRWATSLAEYEQDKSQYWDGDKSLLPELTALEARLGKPIIAWYEAARARDYAVQTQLLHMTKAGIFDYLILGQDDAKPHGPFIAETAHLRDIVEQLEIGGKVYFCEGVDQLSNVLVSRALIRQTDWMPRIRVVYSDPDGRNKIANYESKDVEDSVEDQIFASGARPTESGDCDYTLYLNTPDRDETTFKQFLGDLDLSADRGDPVAVADIDLAKDGTSDPELWNSLWESGRMTKLLAYAGWNTAGNTMGTAIPAANVYLYSKKIGTDALVREVAEREFLLHRFVNDYDYHKYTRPVAYKLIDSLSSNREETYGKNFQIVNNFVRRDLTKRLEDTFDQEFLGQKFAADNREYQISGIDDIRIFLPWPRAYEVRIEFKLETKEVAADQSGVR